MKSGSSYLYVMHHANIRSVMFDEITVQSQEEKTLRAKGNHSPLFVFIAAFHRSVSMNVATSSIPRADGKPRGAISYVGARKEGGEYLHRLLSLLAEAYHFHLRRDAEEDVARRCRGGDVSSNNAQHDAAYPSATEMVRHVAHQLRWTWTRLDGTDEEKYEFFRCKIAGLLMWDRRTIRCVYRDVLQPPAELLQAYRNAVAQRLLQLPVGRLFLQQQDYYLWNESSDHFLATLSQGK